MIFERDIVQPTLEVNLHSDKATALFFAKTDLSPMESLNNSRPSIAAVGNVPLVEPAAVGLSAGEIDDEPELEDEEMVFPSAKEK